MRPKVLKLTNGAELPDRTLAWAGGDGQLIDFTTGYDFELDIWTPEPLIKTSGITGSAGPLVNITISFATGDTDPLEAGIWPGELHAKRTADSKDRDPLPLEVWVYARRHVLVVANAVSGQTSTQLTLT